MFVEKGRTIDLLVRGETYWYGEARGLTVSYMSHNLGNILHELKDGGFVLDKREADCFIVGKLQGPILDLFLPPRTIVGNSTDQLNRASLDLYLEYWQHLGARVGTKRNNQVIWRK